MIDVKAPRLRRTLFAAFVSASVAAPVTGAARPAAVPAPVPAPLAPLRAATPEALAVRYAATRDAVRAAERMAAIGFGADPVSPGFVARVFAAGDGGHSDYLKAGSLPLQNIARIVSGHAPVEARRAA